MPAADRDAHIGAGQGRRIVHTVAHHGHPLALALQLGHLLVLVLRQHLGEVLVDAQLGGHGLRHRLAVAGQHGHLHAHVVQSLHGLLAFRPHHVGQGEGCYQLPIGDQINGRLPFGAGLFGESGQIGQVARG